MALTRVTQGPRVRGTCARLHDTVTYAAPGRVTWVGPCPAMVNGKPCGLKVTCRRFTEVDLTSDPPPPPAASGRRIIPEVGAYLAPSDPATNPGFALPEPGGPPGPDTGLSPTPAQRDDGRPPDRRPDDEPGGPGPDRGGPRARPARRSAWGQFDQPGDWTVPGIYR